MLKASAGGGGRGMRIVKGEEDVMSAFASAKNEAKKAFGIDNIFIEKYLEGPKHIEVQILGDKYGNIVHIYERDCSIQRRHQKLIEFTPATSLSDRKREAICADALKIVRAVNYLNGGTVEFLAAGAIESVYVKEGQRVKSGELLARMK